MTVKTGLNFGTIRIKIGILLVFSLQLNFQNSSGHIWGSETSYDFIVVGGGTGGCVVAGRLAENGLFNVLLIEAGGFPIPEFSVPALSFEKWKTGDPNFIKMYHSEPERNSALDKDGVVDFVTAKVLGGGSTIDGMGINRGSPLDYQSWARYTGDNSWSYQSMRPYFLKFENYTGSFHSGERGFGGPITVSHPKFDCGQESWLQAGRELGYPVASANGPQKQCFAPVDFAMKNGRRVSAFDGYIKPLIGRSNLHILTNTEATRILFKGKRAIGVEYKTKSNGKVVLGSALAGKEILVTAGAIQSPVLLQKSGIGPKNVLDAAKIPVVKHLMTGKNLQDHVMINIPVIVNRSTVFDSVRDLKPASWNTYLQTGEGPYTSFGGWAGQAFLVSSDLRSGKQEGWPDVQLMFLNSPAPQFPLTGVNKEQLQLERDNEMKPNEASVLISVAVARPQSRGTVTLDTSNIDNPPKVNFRFLSHPSDVKVALDGIKTVTKIVATPSFRRLGARLPRTPLASCMHLELKSEEYYRCLMTHNSGTAFHAAGTCRMGRDENDGVVDPELRVIGVKGLRVCDASVMPTLVNANTLGAVYAIAEKAADMILKTWTHHI